MNATMLDAALAYAARGWAVHPLVPFAKTPLTAHGFKDASTDVGQITRWWTATPDANIGVATGKISGITVLDWDEKPWEEKFGESVTLLALVQKHGLLPKREVDVAISLARPSEGRLMARKVTDYKLGLFATNDYPATAPKIRKLADLAQHPFIGYTEEHIFAPELNYLHNLGANIKVPIKSSNLIAQFNAAKSGLGICVLPYFLAKGETKLKPILRDEFILTRSFWLTVHEDQKKLARIKRFSDFVCNEAKRCQDVFLGLS